MTKLTGLRVGVAMLCLATAFAKAQTVQTITNLDGSNGASAFMPLTQGRDGNLYGLTGQGGHEQLCEGLGCGTAFNVTPSGTLTTLHLFCSKPDCTDGAAPTGPLTLSQDGSFYGTTGFGGNLNCLPSFGCGIVFRITPNGKFQVIYDFCGDNCDAQREPGGKLVLADNGYFYGNTGGTVFRISPEGDLTTLYTFCGGCPGGNEPNALIQATDGNFYSTGHEGGGHNMGTLFRMTPAGKVATLHSFDGSDGCYPNAGLVEGTDGNLYGVTGFCGANNEGTIFRLTQSGDFTTLYNFCSLPNCADGGNPRFALFWASDGNLYGTDMLGNCGQIFQFTPTGTFTTLFTFNCADGNFPFGSLSQATSGLLYGTTGEGGEYDYGTIFSLDMGLSPFVAFVQNSGEVGSTGGILGQGFTGTTNVELNGTPAQFTIVSDTYLTATVPPGATTGYVTVTTPTGMLTSNVPFRVIP